MHSQAPWGGLAESRNTANQMDFPPWGPSQALVPNRDGVAVSEGASSSGKISPEDHGCLELLSEAGQLSEVYQLSASLSPDCVHTTGPG